MLVRLRIKGALEGPPLAAHKGGEPARSRFELSHPHALRWERRVHRGYGRPELREERAPDPDEGRHVRRSAGQRAQHRLRGEITRCGLLDVPRQLLEDVLLGSGYDLIIVGSELRAYPPDFRPEIALPEGEREAQR